MQKTAIELNEDGYVVAFATGCDSINDSELVVDCPLVNEDDFIEKYKAYHYDRESLHFDAEKWNEIESNVELSSEEKIEMLQETIDMLTECILEMSELIYS